MPSVAEVIDKCKAIGLEVRLNPAKGGHTLWDIVDPQTNTILTGISSHADRQGGDPNWYFNIRRMLRRAGFEIDVTTRKLTRTLHKGPKKKGAIDLEALAKAQAQAAAAGEHVPTLEDLDEHPEFLQRVSIGGAPNAKYKTYTDDAQDQAMEAMVPKADAPKVHYTVQRLNKILDKYGPELEETARDRLAAEGKRTIPLGKGAKTEFVRIAIEEVAPKRDLRAWKSIASGVQTLYKLLDPESKAGLQLWTVALLEATMDHVEGLKWGEIDETRKRPATPPQEPPVSAPEPEPTPEPTPEPEKVEKELALQLLVDLEEKVATLQDTVIELATSIQRQNAATQQDGMELSIREGYSTTLLDLLGNFNAEQQGNHMLDLIFERLDKLAGIS